MYMEIAVTPIIEIIKVQPNQPEFKKLIYHEWFLPKRQIHKTKTHHVFQHIMSNFVFLPRMLSWMSMITSVIIRYLLLL